MYEDCKITILVNGEVHEIYVPYPLSDGDTLECIDGKWYVIYNTSKESDQVCK